MAQRQDPSLDYAELDKFPLACYLPDTLSLARTKAQGLGL